MSNAATSCAEENKSDKATAAKAKKLIELLVLRGDLSKEEKYSRSRAMTGPWLKLRDLGTTAFPTVIEHLDDKRTSFTQDSGSTDETWTVGRACFDVLRCNVEPFNWAAYSSSIPPEKYWWRPQYCKEFLDTPEKAKKWLATRQDKPLVDLQIEALEWVTKNRAKRKAEISEEDRKTLLDQLETLKRTRKPLAASVPWSR